MGSRGPLKVPSHLRPVGDERKAGTVAETMKRGAPKKPSDLSEEESQLWDELVPVLEENGLIAESDGMSVRLCIAHYLASLKASKEMLAADELSIPDEKNGREMKHPASMIFNHHTASYLSLAKELGLTFASRARTNIAQAKSDGDNPFNSASPSGT